MLIKKWLPKMKKNAILENLKSLSKREGFGQVISILED